MPDIHQTLRETFSLQQFRGQQEPLIRSLLEGNSALAVFPTGAGKSLCYQLPALHFDGITLVISPLIALMKDQVERLKKRGIGAARIDSTLSDDEISDIFQQIGAGTLRLLYVSPERLSGTAFRKKLRDTLVLGEPLKISLLAIDEAHCISEWGHNFRPDYLKIARISRKMKIPRVLALTATATSKVARDIRREFRISKGHHFQSSFHRDNLHLAITPCSPKEKDELLIERIRSLSGSIIVYVTTRKETERVAGMIYQHGFPVMGYHAGLPKDVRSRVQDSFMLGTSRIIVATTAFGMGIDKANIRAVIHYNIPKSIEGYSQEIGRAGRDGQTSHCELLASNADRCVLENFIHGGNPSEQALKNLLDSILRLGEKGHTFAVSPYQLSITNDIRIETVYTILAYLELDHVIEKLGTYHCFCRVKLLRNMNAMLLGRSSKEKLTLQKLFASAELYRGSYQFNLFETIKRTGISKNKFHEHLSELHAAGDARLSWRGLRDAYRIEKKWDGNIQSVTERMIERFQSHASYELARIATMMKLTTSQKCRAQFLTHYFGEALPSPCGTCDNCREQKISKLPAHKPTPITTDEWTRMLALRNEFHASLNTPLQLARYLCGISSPATWTTKLSQRPEYGMWKQHPYEQIVNMLKA